MTTSQGFSLTDVLITLFIMISTAFGLLSQQWLALRVFNETAAQFLNLLKIENDYELALAGLHAPPVSPAGRATP